jgi:hypothetical protein
VVAGRKEEIQMSKRREFIELSRSAHLRREVRLMAIKRLAVIVLLALLAVTLALLLVPGLSWAAVLEWLMTPGSSPCACVLGGG